MANTTGGLFVLSPNVVLIRQSVDLLIMFINQTILFLYPDEIPPLMTSFWTYNNISVYVSVYSMLYFCYNCISFQEIAL